LAAAAKQKAALLIEAIQNDDLIAESEIAKMLPKRGRKYAADFRRLVGIGEPAVYLLVSKRKIMYVGQAMCLMNRLARHPHLLACDEILYLPTSLEDLDARENELIRTFQPPFNKTRGRKPVTKAGLNNKSPSEAKLNS